MSIIVFQCSNDNCNRIIKLKEELAGKRIKCPACGQKLVVPLKSTHATSTITMPPGTSPGVEVATTLPKTDPPQPPIKPMPAAQPARQTGTPPVPPQPTSVMQVRRQYAIMCPKCTGLLMPPRDVKHLVCHHCSQAIELV